MEKHPLKSISGAMFGEGAADLRSRPPLSLMWQVKGMFWIVGLLLLFHCAGAHAAPASEADAILAVRGWLRTSPKPLGESISAKIGSVVAAQDEVGRPLYHVVSLNPEGFVICSADTWVEPILAFSASGHYQADPENPLYALIENDTRDRMKQAWMKTQSVGGSSLSSVVKWKTLRISADESGVGLKGNGLGSVEDPRVDPFIQSRWAQSAVWDGSSWAACYNYYTPPYEAGNPDNYVCGCNNTGWAQIMRYYQYPTQSVGTASFSIWVDGVETSRKLRGGDGAGGVYPWQLMPSIPGSSSSLQERQAIGALCADIGVACGTSYASDGSCAGMDVQTLKDVFFYGNVNLNWVYGDNFHAAVRPNLDARLPVALGIYGDGGHLVVCDGYGFNLASSYYHLNMGWGGTKDAWYNLPDVDADYDHYTTVSVYLYNVYTNGTGEIISGRVLETNNVPIPNALVYAIGGGQTNSTTTDERGIYAFPKLPSDTTFTLRCEKNGYRFFQQQVATGFSDWESTGNKWGVDCIGYNPDIPFISVTPTGLSFGPLLVNATKDMNFAVQNIGGGTLSGTASAGGAFRVLSPSNYSLAESQTQVITVRFNPLSTDSFSNNVTFTGGGGATRSVTGSAAFGLLLTPDERTVGHFGGMTTFFVTNVGGGTMAYSASENETWLGISAVGATGGNGGTITIAFTENPGTTVRTGIVTVTASGTFGSSQWVRVVQAGQPTISLSPSSRAHPPTGAVGQTIGVSANMPWTATVSSPWITISSGATGSGNGTVTYGVAANAGALRSGTITVSGGGINRTFTVNQWPASATPGVSAEGDFDGDARADVAVFNPASVNWAISFSTGPGWTLPWGWSATVPVPADYDGDGLLDLAVYHPASGNWHIQEGGTGQNRVVQLGYSQTVPLPGDYDGDGKADLAVFHQAQGRWHFLCTAAGRYNVQWGWSKTIPVPADYDGDGKTDIAVYHPPSGLWQILKSSTGGAVQKSWGWSTALPVPADYDDDGKADIAVFHRATGKWYVSYSGGGSLTKAFGWSSTIPVAADYDGDGAADLAVYHPATGNWHILKSTTGGIRVQNWGWSAAKPTLLYPVIHSWFRLP